MPITNPIGTAREQAFFFSLESARGSLIAPASNAGLITAGYADMSQNPSFTDSEEIPTNTRGLIDQFQDQTGAGTCTVPFYLRPSGTAGVAPLADGILTSLFGKKTVTSGTKVVYSPAITKPSGSAWFKRGHTLFFSRGGVVDQGKITASNKGAAKLEANLQFMQMGWAGRDGVASAAAAAATQVTVYKAKKYAVGALIHNKTKSDHATVGYTVTAVDVVSNKLTISPGIVTAGGWEVDDIIEGWLPTASTSIGRPIESRKTVVTIGGTARTLQSLDLTFADKVVMIVDEMTPSGFPEDYGEDVRKVSGMIKLHFRANDAVAFYDGSNGTEQAISIQFGDTAGYKSRIDMPRCRLQVPKPSTNAPFVDISIDFTALEQDGEDSITLTFE
jgi:hypothetical protein